MNKSNTLNGTAKADASTTNAPAATAATAPVILAIVPPATTAAKGNDEVMSQEKAA